MFVSYNYQLAYQTETMEFPVPLIWDEKMVPYIPEFDPATCRAIKPYSKDIAAIAPLLVNIDSATIVIGNIIECWQEVPKLIHIQQTEVSEIWDLSAAKIGDLLDTIYVEHQAAKSEMIFVVNWEKISDAFNQFDYRWAHILLCLNRYFPTSLTLAPIMRQEIIDTICNYYYFANWIAIVVRVSSLKASDFVLVRYN